MYKDYRLVLVRRHCMELPWLLSCNRYSFNLALPAEILCPELKVSQGTINTTNGYRTSSVATVQCSNGYRLSGQSSLTCQITGEWTDNEPTCERKELVLYPLMVGNILCTYIYSSGINTVHTINIACKICISNACNFTYIN